MTWLAEAQHEDGTWGAGSSSRQQIRDPHAVQGDPATTSFAAMAFLRSGHTPQKGKYRQVVKKATEALVKVVEQAPATRDLKSLNLLARNHRQKWVSMLTHH